MSILIYGPAASKLAPQIAHSLRALNKRLWMKLTSLPATEWIPSQEVDPTEAGFKNAEVCAASLDELAVALRQEHTSKNKLLKILEETKPLAPIWLLSKKTSVQEEVKSTPVNSEGWAQMPLRVADWLNTISEELRKSILEPQTGILSLHPDEKAEEENRILIFAAETLEEIREALNTRSQLPLTNTTSL